MRLARAANPSNPTGRTSYSQIQRALRVCDALCPGTRVFRVLHRTIEHDVQDPASLALEYLSRRLQASVKFRTREHRAVEARMNEINDGIERTRRPARIA